MKSNHTYCFSILGLLAIASILLSLFKGSTLIHPQQLITAIFSQQDALTRHIFLTLRLPRTGAAFVTGGLLALAGALMQILLRNPLADPYVLGISGGAALGSLLCILCGLTGYWITGGAWLGSLCAILLVFALAKSKNMLLIGIAVASGFAALISFILLISPDRELRSMLFWLLGDLSYAHVPVGESCILLLGLIISMSFARQLNIFVRGEPEARALGVHTTHLQIRIYFLSALLTAAAVTLAGCVGFVGLIVPHIFRLLYGSNHRYLLPGSVLLGGSLVTLADTLSRTLFAPIQLPVGIMMSLIGIPIFIGLLLR